MERRERIGHLLGDAEDCVALAIRFFGNHHEKELREHVKKARMKLKQALESIDGID
jgi:hypothetical protein